MASFLQKAGFQTVQIRTYRHTISVRYLAYKLRGIGGFWARVSAKLMDTRVLAGRHITFALGDFMEVVAVKLI